MSGPKCGNYRVVSAAELARRRLAAARDRWARLDEQVRALRAEAEGVAAAYHVDVPAIESAPPTSTDPDEWEGFLERVERSATAARAHLDSAVAGARVQSMIDRFPETSAAGGVEFGHAAAPVDVSVDVLGVESSEATAERVAARLRDVGRRALELLGGLPPGSDPASLSTLSTCEAIVDEIVTAGTVAEATTALEMLRFRCDQARTRADRRTANTERRERLLQMLDGLDDGLEDGLDGLDVGKMRGRLRAMDPDAEWPTTLDTEVEAMSDAAARRRDDQFVLAQARDALAELGYGVDDGFETEVGTGGGVVLAIPDATRHGVRVRHRNGQLMFNVVRVDPSGQRSEADDTEAEESFCTDFGQFREALADGGVALELTRADAPGSSPVEVVRDGAAVRRPASSDRSAPARSRRSSARRARNSEGRR